jgi:hypothetical protein
MDLEPSKVAKDSAEPYPRRFPWMAHEDIVVLQALPTGLAHQFEALIHRQARSDARFSAHTYTYPDPEELDGWLRANVSHGAGGGRRRTTNCHRTPWGEPPAP